MENLTAEPIQPRPLADHSVVDIISALASCIDRQPTRLDVLKSWLTTHAARNIIGGQGIVAAIADETGLHERTVMLHIKAITCHPVMGQVFKYRQSK